MWLDTDITVIRVQHLEWSGAIRVVCWRTLSHIFYGGTIYELNKNTSVIALCILIEVIKPLLEILLQ